MTTVRTEQFVRDEVLPSWWANRIQDRMAGEVRLQLARVNATTIKAVAGPDDALSALNVQGLWRFIEADVTRAHPGGGAGLYLIYAVAKNQAIVSVPAPFTDNTDYAFDLRIVASPGTPPIVAGTVDVFRRIGRLQWDGAAITQLWQEAGVVHGPALDDDVIAAGGQVVATRDLNGALLLTVPGSPATVFSGQAILDVGQVGQRKAGRVLTVADFTTLLGLAQPALLANLGDLTNLGSGGALTNKGAVPFGTGILGAATSAAVFAGSTAQAIYSADAGAADPYRIRTGSWGGWWRTAKRAVQQTMLSKGAAAVTSGYGIDTNNGNVVRAWIHDGTALFEISGTTDVCDDRWHFVVATFDGSALRLFVDGLLEATMPAATLIGVAGTPLNIGGRAADGATVATLPFFGRVDEAFVTPDVLSDEGVRLLFCSKTAHGYPSAPTRSDVAITRRRRGAVLAAADFSSTPVRLHNLNNSLADLGSGAVALTANPGTGAIVDVAGPDGARLGARAYSGAHNGDSSTDAGLPAGTASRSFGAWFKTAALANQGIVAWGTVNTADARMVVLADGRLQAASGGDTAPGVFAADGLWHFGVVVEDNAAADGVKRKLYMDGRLVGSSTVLTALTLAGANRFRVGADSSGAVPIVGSVARAFVHSIALTPEQVMALYAKGAQALGVSTVPEGEVVEASDATSVYFAADGFEPQQLLDLRVAA